MTSMDSLEELLQDELKDTYDAEKQLTKALPKLVKKAANEELRTALDDHLRETEQHVQRLEDIFEQLGMPARGKTCTGMQNLIKEGNTMIGEAEEPARDAVMIAAAQKVEHYEIAAYGTMRTWANQLGKTDIAALLEDTLEEEKQADHKLTEIAENLVNVEAAQGGEAESSSRRGATRGSMRRSGNGASRRPVAADRSKSSSRRSGSRAR
jgi:ferritin-like metal-binding protein YciE